MAHVGTAVLVFFLSLMPTVTRDATAQSPQPTAWAAVMALPPGRPVRVEATDGRSARGTVRNVEREAIVLYTPDGLQTFPRSNILTVASVGRSRAPLRGAVIGGVAGLLYGGVATAVIARGGESGEPVGGPLLIPVASASVGAAIGAIVDLAIGRPGDPIVYRAPHP